MQAEWMRKAGWMLLGGMLGGLLILGVNVGAGSLVQERKGYVGLPFEQMQAFVELYTLIQDNYVEDVAPEKLFENAMKGMVSLLDPHSDYLTPEEFAEMQEHTTGEFGGLGMEVAMDKSGLVKVVAPIDDTPAQRAGIRSGDLIIKIDDKPVKGMTLNDAVKLMRGKPGTRVTLTILREGEQKPLVFTLERAIIKVKSVRTEMLPDGYGYVRLSQFQLRTAYEMTSAIVDLEKQAGHPLKGIVLDLRDNPGGVLDAAVNVSDAFLEEGVIVYTKGRNEDARMRFDAEGGDILDGRPIVVLVNEGSASASEIVAGALQDHRRALVAGRKTFGKGSVQTLFSMRNGAAIKLTTARYYTPSGRSIQAEGIEPDALIPRLTIAKVGGEDVLEVHEADLEGHLEHKDDKPVQQDEKAADDGQQQEKVQALLKKDYELYQALMLLKSLSLASRMGGN